MELARLFLFLDGRIGRRDWWQGVLLLVLAVGAFVPMIGLALSTATGSPTVSFKIWSFFLAPPLSYLVLALHV